MADLLGPTAVRALAVLGADQIFADLGDGYAALRPAVHVLPRPDADTINVDLPFPCVGVAGWSCEDGLTPLRHSLVVLQSPPTTI